MELHVGCAMWTYAPWQGRYLPGSLPPRDRLRAYATWCNAVEGNTTFYATPALGTVKSWAEQTTPDFRFILKLPKSITHERRLADVGDPLRAFLAAIEPLGSYPVVRYLGRDDAARTVAGWQPWADAVAGWLREGRSPTVFIHTPDNVGALELACPFSKGAVLEVRRPGPDGGSGPGYHPAPAGGESGLPGGNVAYPLPTVDLSGFASAHTPGCLSAQDADPDSWSHDLFRRAAPGGREGVRS